MRPYNVIVIGGGASGLMAAGRAAERGQRVLLLEKNKRLGEKLRITGGGRCNITNAEEIERIFLGHYGSAASWLYSPFSQFGVKETFSFFTDKGLPLVTQANKRVFPETEKAVDVLQVLEKYINLGQVKVITNIQVNQIIGQDGIIEKVIANGEEFIADSYIIATGGKSHPETGSTGDGFLWLKNLGHSVIDPTPTVVPLSVADEWIKSLAGISLEEIKITFFVDDKKKKALKGKILCTHFGLSGPLILNIAGQVANWLHEGIVTAKIDTYPDLDLGALDKHITNIFDDNKNKFLKNVFKIIAPSGASSAILSLLPNIDPEIAINNITKQQRKQLVDLLKSLPVNITGLMGLDRAVVVDGGLDIKEVDNKTMCSKLYNNLFITGDLLHISRPSGGYSLQLCWTTGWVAGSHV